MVEKTAERMKGKGEKEVHVVWGASEAKQGLPIGNRTSQ